jgi:hypothetical protein
MDVHLGERLGHDHTLPSPFRALGYLDLLPQGGTMKPSLPGLDSGGPSGRKRVEKILPGFIASGLHRRQTDAEKGQEPDTQRAAYVRGQDLPGTL